MLSNNLALLFVCGLVCNIAEAANSDGKEFIFSFIRDQFIPLSPAATTTVIVIPSTTDSVCTFKYTQKSDNQVVSRKNTALYGKTNEISLNINEVISIANYTGNQFFDTLSKDFRIFVSCTEEVKLIGRVNDPINTWGDLFNIPSIQNGGTEYTLSLPSTDSSVKGAIAFLPIDLTSSIDINVIGYSNGQLFSNKSVNYKTALGQKQYYVSIDLYQGFNYDFNVTLTITASKNIMLTFVSPWATTNNVDSLCGKTCKSDYLTFMPISSTKKKCNVLLAKPDQRMITSDFTTRLYVSPPNMGFDCNEVLKITVFDNSGNTEGKDEIVSNIGLTTLDLIDEIAFTSTSGQMSTYRLGSILQPGDAITSYGHYGHYIPSTAEWVTGTTQFFSLAKDCYIEFYADQNGSDINSIKLDGIILSSIKHTKKPLSVLNSNYNQFVADIKGYGLHKFENGGNYVLYIVCKNVNGLYDSQGYLTAFNKRN
uniref:IgGFc_binding domain-containing protein n=1 Tax=Rhabditophanes sp. KR3021 TaxID=114890 RepID=A0AC35TLU2_9BILA